MASPSTPCSFHGRPHVVIGGVEGRIGTQLHGELEVPWDQPDTAALASEVAQDLHCMQPQPAVTGDEHPAAIPTCPSTAAQTVATASTATAAAAGFTSAG